MPCGRKVVIAGGGMMIPNAVKICKELGAETITVISRKPPEKISYDSKTLEAIESRGQR